MEYVFKTFDQLSKVELYAILRLRAQIFVVEQNCPYVDTDNLDQEAHHLWLAEEGVIYAYARILKPGSYYQEPSIGRVVTGAAARGTGLGRQMFTLAIKETQRLYPSLAMRIMAQSYLIRFYESFGFEVVSEEFLEDGIPHVEMLLNTSPQTASR